MKRRKTSALFGILKIRFGFGFILMQGLLFKISFLWKVEKESCNSNVVDKAPVEAGFPVKCCSYHFPARFVYYDV
jgi:hypothetical protein